jgi:endonuclease-3
MSKLSKKSTLELLIYLDKTFGEIKPFLDHKNAFELLIAVILSAQTTDVMVNKVTPDLFTKYPDAKSLKIASLEEVEILIKRINYYRTKAKNIIKTAKMIDEVYESVIPNTIGELVNLAGVGRKVANVIVADIFGIAEGVVVDTHVKRVSKRIGWTDSINPVIIERDLIKAWPEDHYVNTPKHLILIGRNYCFPKNPKCSGCPAREWCLKRI